MPKQASIVFVSLAMNQAVFFEAVGVELEKKGYRVSHVAFHEGSVAALLARGRRVFNPYKREPSTPSQVDFADFGVEHPGLLIGHEKAAYQLRDSAELVRKFKAHLQALGSIVDGLLAEGPNLVMVQELGGFTSVLAAFYAARRRGITNWFIEPCFYRGRVFFTPDSFAAPKILPTGTPANADVRRALDTIGKDRVVVIPDKDKLHYRGALSKLTDKRNVRRLFEKLTAKHVRGEHEEFDHIGGHVLRHVRMAVNGARLRPHYQSLPIGKPILYYPLHVPADFALTIRCPEYWDQYAVIDYVCRIAPLGTMVAIKEHPALVGAVDPNRILDLLHRHDNLALLSPGINNHEIVSACEAVVTINSKAGSEALLYEKPVFALGDSFYRHSGLVTAIGRLAELPAKLASPVRYSRPAVESFFQDVWDRSAAGELYLMGDENISRFAASLEQCLNASRDEETRQARANPQ